jgi:hypothetical protein
MYRAILNRLTVVVTILCALSMINLAASAAQAPYEVGQYWQYNHQGPRPGATEPKTIDGERILHVIGTVGTDPEQQWIIEDRFTNDPNIVGRLQVRGDRMLTALVIENEKGESLTLSYSQPIPYQTLDMTVGGSMQIVTELVAQPSGFKLPCTLQITRLDDETLDTPAGRFAVSPIPYSTSRSPKSPSGKAGSGGTATASAPPSRKSIPAIPSSSSHGPETPIPPPAPCRSMASGVFLKVSKPVCFAIRLSPPPRRPMSRHTATGSGPPSPSVS